jgi:hypothetical protein
MGNGAGAPRPPSQLHPVPRRGHPLLACAMGAAIHSPFRLNAVAEDTAAAVLTRRGQRLDGAFKAIKRVHGTSHGELKGLIILIAAGFTPCHGDLLCGRNPSHYGLDRSVKIPAGHPHQFRVVPGVERDVLVLGQPRRHLDIQAPPSNRHDAPEAQVVKPGNRTPLAQRCPTTVLVDVQRCSCWSRPALAPGGLRFISA